MITTLIQAIKTATSLPIRPVANYNQDCIAYIYYPQMDNGATAQDRLEIKLIASSLTTIETQTALIKGALMHKGDESPFIGCSIELGGGGSLYDEDAEKYIQLMYFDITRITEV